MPYMQVVLSGKSMQEPTVRLYLNSAPGYPGLLTRRP